MKLGTLFFVIFLSLTFSCATGPIVIPEDMPPSKIIQTAQEATDNSKYKTAIQYYQILLERHGEVSEYYCIAQYEIAFIRYKQKRYTEAQRGFENLLVLYDAEGGGTLPIKFKILSEKVLAAITEKGR